MLGEIEHVLRDFDILNLVEIFLLRAQFIWIAQDRTDQSLVEWFERNDVFEVREDDSPNRDLVHLADRLPDHREGVMADLAVRPQIVGADQIAWIDVFAVNELVNLDGPRRLRSELLK